MICRLPQKMGSAGSRIYTASIIAEANSTYAVAIIDGIQYGGQNTNVEFPANGEITVICKALADIDGSDIEITLNGSTVASGEYGDREISYTFTPTGNLTITLKSVPSSNSRYSVGQAAITM